MIKKFESFESDEYLNELEDIFSEIELDYPCSISSSEEPSMYVPYKGKESDRYTVSIKFDKNSKIQIREFLKSIWSKILFARNMGFESYSNLDKCYGIMTLQMDSPNGKFSKNPGIDDSIFGKGQESRINYIIYATYKLDSYKPGGYLSKFFKDAYEAFDKTFKVIEFNLWFNIRKD